jgi:tRNA(fMet)-specific endonuclease VapC
MIPSYLLDTNICIYIQQNRSVNVSARFQRLRPGEAVLSVITYGELLYGAAKSRQKSRALEALAELVQLLPVTALPEEAGRVYGEFRATLEIEGRIIGNNDLWIAAHAKVSNLTLVTNNEREFKRIRGLKIQNWVAG